MIIVKTFLALFLILWIGAGLYLVVKFEKIFGRHRDDPSETAGASSLNVSHIASIWFGFFALAAYFLFT